MKKKIGINQLKFSKGKKIYTKGDVAHFAYYVHSGKVNIYSPGGLLLGKIGEVKFLEKEVHLLTSQGLLQLKRIQIVSYILLMKKH